MGQAIRGETTRGHADAGAAKAGHDIPCLTGIRGVAALWVLARHLDPLIAGPDFPGRSLMHNGWSAVDLFFVLSGFILAHAHADRLAHPDAAAIRRYAAGRVRRVCPPNIAALAAIGLLLALDPAYAAWRGFDGFPLAAMTDFALLLTAWLPPTHDVNDPVWSLSAEVVGYCALPALAWWMARRRAASATAVAAGCFLAYAAIRYGLHQSGTNPTTGWGALVRITTCFTAGVALRRVRAAVPTPRTGLAAAATVAASIGILAAASTWRLADALPALYGVLILALSYEEGPVARLLASRPAMLMGAISFPFYLVHMTFVSYLRYLVERHGWAMGWDTAAMVFAGSVTASAMLHRWVEAPPRRQALGHTPATATA